MDEQLTISTLRTFVAYNKVASSLTVVLSFSVQGNQDRREWRGKTSDFREVSWSAANEPLELGGAFHQIKFVHFSGWCDKSRLLLKRACRRTTRLVFEELDYKEFWRIFHWRNYKAKFIQAAGSVTSVFLGHGYVRPEEADTLWSTFSKLQQMEELHICIDRDPRAEDPHSNFALSFFENFGACRTLKHLSLGLFSLCLRASNHQWLRIPSARGSFLLHLSRCSQHQAQPEACTVWDNVLVSLPQ